MGAFLLSVILFMIFLYIRFVVVKNWDFDTQKFVYIASAVWVVVGGVLTMLMAYNRTSGGGIVQIIADLPMYLLAFSAMIAAFFLIAIIIDQMKNQYRC